MHPQLRGGVEHRGKLLTTEPGSDRFRCGDHQTEDLLMGLEMLHGAPTRVQHDDPEQQAVADRVLVPLAMPLLAGPGAITTVLTLSSRADTWRGTAMLLVAVAIVGATIGIILLSAARVGGAIGSRGQRILLRFMGLILAAVGAEILLAGLYTFVPRPA